MARVPVRARVIKAWLLPRIQSEMKKVHGLHRTGF